MFSGLSEREVSGNSHVEEVEEVEELPPGHANHHDHHDNIDLADLVLDTEHILDDLDIYTKKELESMDVDEKVNKYRFLYYYLYKCFIGIHLVQCP